jgi:ribonuclease P/MRP protein subunit RPP40
VSKFDGRKAAQKGNQILGLISHAFMNKSRFIIKMLYKSLVHPHLDYCVQAWRPHLERDKEVLERVQKRATRMINDYKALNRVERAAKGLSYRRG